MTEQPAVYNAGVGYPVNEVKDGNLTLVDVYGTGQYGVLTAAKINGVVSLVASADTTGAADVASFNTALNNLPLSSDGLWKEGTIRLGPGHYYFGSATVNIGPHVLIQGAGKNVTFLHSMVGAGVSTFSQHGDVLTTGDFFDTRYGGGWRDLTIDGSLATPGAIGLDVGDTMELEFNLRVTNFTGNVRVQNCVVTSGSALVTITGGGTFPAGVVAGMRVSGGTGGVSIPASTTVASVSADRKTVTLSGSSGTVNKTGGITFAPTSPAGGIGIWARNYNSWSEKWHGTLMLSNNDTGLVVDVTASPIDGSTHSTPSHEFWDMTIYVYMGTYQNGIAVQNGSSISSGHWRLFGNWENSNDVLTAFSVFHLTGTVPAGHPSAGNGAQAAMVNFTLGFTVDLAALANAPVRLQIDNNTEAILPGVSRTSNRTGNDVVNAGATLYYPVGGVMHAATPGGSNPTNSMDGVAIAPTGGSTTAGLVQAEQIAGTALAVTGNQGQNYKQVVIYMSGWTYSAPPTFNWTVGFANKPEITSNTTGLTPTAVTTGHIILPAPTTATGIIVLTGF